MSNPYFSIVVPMYNRERFIGRALRSCLVQEFGAFEVIVIDDCSSDGSVRAVREFDDDRIVLLQLERNQGPCAARNAGMEKARGEWVVFLDSDDELTPGALAAIHRRATEPGRDFARMLFSCRGDSGQISPDPPLPDAVWSYADCLRWIEEGMSGVTETLPCIKTETYPNLRYHDGRVYELGYHLDCARAVKTRVCPDIVRLYHADAPNRLVVPSPARILEGARDTAADLDLILRAHGQALREHAPAFCQELQRGAITYNLLAGHRLRGLRHAWRHLRRSPGSTKTWVVLALGVVHPRLLAYFKSRFLAGATRNASRESSEQLSEA